MQRIAIIDLGSNSARLVIIQVYKSLAHNMVFNQKETLRLSQKVTKQGKLTEAACASAITCLRSFAAMCQLYKADKIYAVATAAIRNATNGKELCATIEQETGIKLSILSGEREAYLSYLGVVNTIAEPDCIIFDLGGGSMELNLVRNHKLVESVSIPLGAVNLTALYKCKDTLSPSVYAILRKKLSTYFSKIPWLKDAHLPLIGVGGTARALAKLHQKQTKYFTSKLHGYEMTSAQSKATINSVLTTNLAQRRLTSGIAYDRADIILAGFAVIKALLTTTHAASLSISGCGLREGLFREYYHETYGPPLIVEDLLEVSRQRALNLYAPDKEHALYVAELTMKMFSAWKSLHKLSERWRELLLTAALLHDIGININYYSHPRHSGYMIDNAKLFGLTHKEQALCALIASCHNGIAKGYLNANKQLKDVLSITDLRNVYRCALLLTLAESLDYSETGLITEIHPTQGKKNAILHLKAPQKALAELHQVATHAKWFKKTLHRNLVVKIEQ